MDAPSEQDREHAALILNHIKRLRALSAFADHDSRPAEITFLACMLRNERIPAHRHFVKGPFMPDDANHDITDRLQWAEIERLRTGEIGDSRLFCDARAEIEELRAALCWIADIIEPELVDQVKEKSGIK